MNTTPKTLTEAIHHTRTLRPALTQSPSCVGRMEVRYAHAAMRHRERATLLAQDSEAVEVLLLPQAFSGKVGTIFEDSPLGLNIWLTALWILANCRNGFSSYEIARATGIAQKNAWFFLQRLRFVMKDTRPEMLATAL